MTKYQFIKDYKNNNQYRSSFNKLAKKTFGIDFENWFQQGFWNDNYICYSYLKDDEVISNVSLSTMDLIIDGSKQKAIQIGTVMTDLSYRRQGLANQLMQRIFNDYDSDYDLYFLAADDEAISLYEKCGFKINCENEYVIDLAGYSKLEKALEPFPVPAKKLLEIKRQSQPLSNVLSAVGDEHVLMYYFTSGFSNFIYRPQPDVYTIFEIEGNMLHLYDILSPKKINLHDIIEQITPKNVEKVFCHFTPDKPIAGLISSTELTGNWMIRSKPGINFPKPARFPRISQT